VVITRRFEKSYRPAPKKILIAKIAQNFLLTITAPKPNRKAPAFRTSEILRREQGHRFVYYYKPFSSKVKGMLQK